LALGVDAIATWIKNS